MALESTEFVDHDLVVQDRNNIGSNRIRLRELSFSGVTEAYRNYRKKKLEEQLNDAKNKLAGAVAFAGPDGNVLESEKKVILERTTAVAKLEKIIKIIDKEDIPHDFVRSRAIKLLDTWLENCKYNGASAYSVGLNNQDKLFAEAPAVEEAPVVERVTENFDSDEISDDMGTINTPVVVEEPVVEHVDEVTDNFENPAPQVVGDEAKVDDVVESSPVVSTSSNEVTDEVVNNAVNSFYAGLESVSDEVQDHSQELEFNDTADITAEVGDEALQDTVVELSAPGEEEQTISRNAAEEVIDSKFAELTDEHKVSKNPEVAAKVGKYADGNDTLGVSLEIPKKSFKEIVPRMELKPVALEKENDRMVVITPPRPVVEKKELIEEKVDVSAETPTADYTFVPEEFRAGVLSESLEKLRALQQKRDASAKEREEAELMAAKTNEEAAAIKDRTQKVTAAYDARIGMIEKEISKLEEATKADEKQAEMASLSIAANRRFIDYNQESMDSMLSELESAKSLLGDVDSSEYFDEKGMKRSM